MQAIGMDGILVEERMLLFCDNGIIPVVCDLLHLRSILQIICIWRGETVLVVAEGAIGRNMNKRLEVVCKFLGLPRVH